MAKSFVMAAVDAGVDITDEEEMNKFTALYNMQLQQLAEVEGDRAASKLKIGRNDPCPCGSGKKYKKCCLKAGKG